MRALLVFITFLAVMSPWRAGAAPPAARTELANADKALADGRYADAHRYYLKAAAHNSLAQFDLGLMAREGWGRPRDPEAACRWFEKAAQGKVPAAEQFFGDCLAEGTGRAVDGDAAIAWYQRAAQSGIAYAWCSAGDLFITGRLVPRDIARGIALCTRAAQAGSPPAMRRLGDYYREGTDVPGDAAAARYWYGQAAERRDAEAQYRLGLMFNQGEGGDADSATALHWLELAASQGEARAYLPVAVLYANASPDPDTGRLAPDVLAKIYMWNRAAGETALSPDARAEVARIQQLTLAAMPPQWRPALDRRVAAHLARFPAPRDAD